MTRFVKNIQSFAKISIVFSFAGCIITQSVRPEKFNDDDKDVVLTTLDARKVKFFAGHYQVIGIDSSRRFVGKGEQWVSDDRSTKKEFAGEIPFYQVAEIETVEKTVFYYSGPILLGVAAASSLLLVIIIFSGRGLGG